MNFNVIEIRNAAVANEVCDKLINRQLEVTLPERWKRVLINIDIRTNKIARNSLLVNVTLTNNKMGV